MESKRDIESVLAFVRQHQQEDVDRLLLSAKKYPEVDTKLREEYQRHVKTNVEHTTN